MRPCGGMPDAPHCLARWCWKSPLPSLKMVVLQAVWFFGTIPRRSAVKADSMQHRQIVPTMTLLPATWVTASPRLLQIQETPALNLVSGPVPLYNIPPNPKPQTPNRTTPCGHLHP